LDRALVLCADHELNASTFAARVAASTGSDLYACLGAALHTLSGPLHGGASARVEALLCEIAEPARAEPVLRERRTRGELVAGFGQPIYVEQGDPRGRALFELAEQVVTTASASPSARGGKLARRTAVGGSRRSSSRNTLQPIAADAARASRRNDYACLIALVAAMKRAGHPAPNLDAGLVAVTTALDLPAGAAAAVFAIGRIPGWVTHALEQRSQGYILRPRARYVAQGESSIAAESREAMTMDQQRPLRGEFK